MQAADAKNAPLGDFRLGGLAGLRNQGVGDAQPVRAQVVVGEGPQRRIIGPYVIFGQVWPADGYTMPSQLCRHRQRIQGRLVRPGGQYRGEVHVAAAGKALAERILYDHENLPQDAPLCGRLWLPQGSDRLRGLRVRPLRI